MREKAGTRPRMIDHPEFREAFEGLTETWVRAGYFKTVAGFPRDQWAEIARGAAYRHLRETLPQVPELLDDHEIEYAVAVCQRAVDRVIAELDALSE